MASNYFPVGLLDQPWDDESLGTLSSLERRQRKAAEKSDINAFCKFLGVVFITLNFVLLGSELYTFATEPSRGLTGAFLMEIGRMSRVAYDQLQNLYKAVGDIAWTGIAVIHGPDFAQKGVDIAHSTAQVLASALQYLAMALCVLVLYYAMTHLARAPLRNLALTSLAACGLFGAPPLYSLLVSRLFPARSPEPVVLWALLFSGVMCSGSLSMARVISSRAADSQSGGHRHRSASVSRRQPGTSGTAASAGTSASGSGGAAAVGSSAGHAFKRCSYSRASSFLGRGGGPWTTHGGGSTAAEVAAESTQPSVARCGSSVSLAPGCGLWAGINNLPASSTEPLGLLASSCGLQRTRSGSSSSIDHPAAVPHQQMKHAPAAGISSAATCNGRGRHSGQSNATSTFDPVSLHSKHSETTNLALNIASTPGSGGGGTIGNGRLNIPATAAKAGGGGKLRHQAGGAPSDHTGSGVDGTFFADTNSKSAAGTGGAASACSPASRTAVADPASASAGMNGSSAGKPRVAAHSSTANKVLQHNAVAAPRAGASASSFSSCTAATSTIATGAASSTKAKKKAQSSQLGSSNSSTTSSLAGTASTAVPEFSVANPAAAHTTASSGAPGTSRQVTSSKPTTCSSTVVHSTKTESAADATNAAVHTAPVPSTGGITGAGGLLSRLTATVVSVASSAPVTSSRTAKKTVVSSSAVATVARKPQSQQPQYVIVPPPPPPPRKSPQPPAADLVAAASTANTPSSPAAPCISSGNQTRNPWLNPNPAIKLAAGVAKGPKGHAAMTSIPQPAPIQSTFDATAATHGCGGTAGTHQVVPSLTVPSSRRSWCDATWCSSGGDGGGVTSADPPVTIAGPGTGSPHTYSHSTMLPEPAVGLVTAQSPLRDVAAIGQPTVRVASTNVAPPPLAFLPPQAKEQLRNHFQSFSGANTDAFISTSIVSADVTLWPLVAHKHASGDLDIASVAANYLPYPSSLPSAAPPSSGLVVSASDLESAESFSLFSTPPPLIITAEATADPTAVTASVPVSLPMDADTLPLPDSAASHALYGMYGHYAVLPSIGGDPVWSHNVPSVFAAPSALNSSRGNAGTPPGFPSHAYGGAFATGPVSSSVSSSGWNHPPAAAAAVAANLQADTLPLPPAGKNGVLASLGFVDDGTGVDGNASGGGSGSGGDDAAASCAICWSAPRQVGFLHGKTSHLCVCRRCASKLREGVHRCPMCRQLIERIIDIY